MNGRANTSSMSSRVRLFELVGATYLALESALSRRQLEIGQNPATMAESCLIRHTKLWMLLKTVVDLVGQEEGRNG
jgi:hypothetical protein